MDPAKLETTGFSSLGYDEELPPLRNAAFVFVKPHACTLQVREHVQSKLIAKGLRVLAQEPIEAAEINEKKLIDQHYYAIASKATLVKPAELNVPPEKFKSKFGLSWDEAKSRDLVFNASDACAKLGVDGKGLEQLWRAASDTKLVIKFGGGFYCGKILPPGGGANAAPLYVFNGFFMSMREAFTGTGKQIYYYSVAWEASDLAWHQFRSTLLGDTDPSLANPGSIRHDLYTDWEMMDLESQPNTGNNGVHASASPFEGLAERCNWLGAFVEEDDFGRHLLAAKIGKQWIIDGFDDPQVRIDQGGTMGSLFDEVENTDAETCIQKLKVLHDLSVSVNNAAFVFIKPHAVTSAYCTFVSSALEREGIRIQAEGDIACEDIDERELIDQHYYSIASKATLLQPEELPVPAEKFEQKFGLSWEDAKKQRLVFNAKDACLELGVDGQQMETMWRKCQEQSKMVKFGGGFYCGQVEREGVSRSGGTLGPIYVFNGFFMAMRSAFTEKGKRIHYYSVEWDPRRMSWKDFRGKFLGSTDPASAPPASLRGTLHREWRNFDLSQPPNTGNNGVHASASPFEGLAERNNWLREDIQSDPFGKMLVQAGIDADWIREGCRDPQVSLGPTADMGSLFDAVEDTDAETCVQRLVQLHKAR